MSITNQDKPNSSIANTSKAAIGETWGSIMTRWSTETRTWLLVSQLISNIARAASLIANISKPA